MPSETGAYSYSNQNFELEKIDRESTGQAPKQRFRAFNHQDIRIDEAFLLIQW